MTRNGVRYFMMAVIVVMIALMMSILPGCAMFQAATQSTVVDTYCLTAKKRKWSVDDRPEVIREARIENQVIDRRCGGSTS